MATEQDLEPLLSNQQEHVGFLLDQSDGIDTKALAILAINIALLIFIAQSESVPGGFWWGALLYGPFVASLVLNGFAIWPRRYDSVGVNLDKYPDYLSMDRDSLLLQLLADTERVISNNTYTNSLRMRYCIISILLTALGTVVLFAIL